jgi:hypothetical protein
LLNLKHLATTKIFVEPYGEITIHRIDSEVQDRTMQLRGITWWVQRRVVGNPSWEGLDGEGAYLDGRTTLAKRFSFVVEADILKEGTTDVKTDWSGFHASRRFNLVRDAVHKFVVASLNEIQASSRKERKTAALAETKSILKELSTISKNAVGTFIDQIQEKCPTLSERDLFRTAEIFGKMEQARSGYDLLKQLQECSLKTWTLGIV